MRKMLRLLILLGLLSVGRTAVTVQAAPAGETAVTPAVQAVLFYSPSCPHCHYVITDVLTPLQETYGERLQILGLSTQESLGAQLYNEAIDYYKIPDSRLGVPTLIIANTVLVGSLEIEQQFPPLVEAGFTEGGIAWPALPALHLVFPDLPGVNEPPARAATDETAADAPAAEEAAVAESADAEPAAEPEAESAAAVTVETEPALEVVVPPALTLQEETAAAETDPSAAAAPPSDPVGMGLAWGVMGLLFVSLPLTARLLQKPAQRRPNPALSGLIPVLGLLGLGIALYLSYVEITQVAAVCGPVGACNVVQSSPYARIGFVPVAVLGALNYLALLLLWGWQQVQPAAHSLIRPMLLGLTILGTLFSIYLTVLEIFVIHAVCLWCLSSAVTTALLMLLLALLLRATAVPDADGAAKGAWS